VCYPRPGGLPSFHHEKGISLKSTTDGTSKTFLFGEHYNQDEVFDSMSDADRNGLKIHQWALWGWMGNYSGTGHVTRGSGDSINFQGVINRQCPQSCRTSSNGYQCTDDRLQTWGSGHPGGANWTFGDGSARFLTYTIDTPQLPPATGQPIQQTTLTQLCTRNGGEVILGDL